MDPTQPKILAIIPARGGSKRLSGKNLKPISGRPLLAYSILTARACPSVSYVAVSSQDLQILQAARQWGAVAVHRPDELASDTAPTVLAMKHALETVELMGHQVDHVALFQPTCPLRWVTDTERAIQSYLELGADSAISVNEVRPKLGRLTTEGWFAPQYTLGIRKQDMKPYFQENGALYLSRAELTRAGSLLGPKTMPLTLAPETGCISIDTEFDFQLTEALFRELNFEQEFSRLEADKVRAAA